MSFAQHTITIRVYTKTRKPETTHAELLAMADHLNEYLRTCQTQRKDEFARLYSFEVRATTEEVSISGQV